MNENRMRQARSVRFDPETGLVPAIVESPEGRVLMLGYMNEEALARTLECGRVTFFSRSRGRLWQKGETSGHALEALQVRVDCDGDALLVMARPLGPTCHTGSEGCFDAEPLWCRLSPSPQPDRASRARGPTGSGDRRPGDQLERLIQTVAARDRERPAGSYTASLLAAGLETTARKVGEEALETILASSDPPRLAAESADLLYHLVVLWRAAGLEPERVAAELAARRRPPGETKAGGATSSP